MFSKLWLAWLCSLSKQQIEIPNSKEESESEKSNPTVPPPTQTPIETSVDLGKAISISIRAPNGARFKLDQLREHSGAHGVFRLHLNLRVAFLYEHEHYKTLQTDTSELMSKMEENNFSPVQYELIRAYPRQKIDLTPGQSLSDLAIKNQDAFHVQLKM